MHDNKVSEKAVWEGSITPDSDTPYLDSQAQSQPQMMFCYKCNNVIPCNSNYCPYCQVKLFTECPKCGAKYSSQYPACSQCGTNREEYLREQRREQERKEAIERENRRQREIAERERLEEERKAKEAEAERERLERLKRHEQQEKERKQKEAYLKVNEEIMKTKEYETTYSLLTEAIEAYKKEQGQKIKTLTFLLIISLILAIFTDFIGPIAPIVALLAFPTYAIITAYISNRHNKEKFLLNYISKNICYDLEIVKYAIILLGAQGEKHLSECCIVSYREKRGLPIIYKWCSWAL